MVNLEGGLDQVLFAAEGKFSEIPVHILPQESWNINIECARKSK